MTNHGPVEITVTNHTLTLTSEREGPKISPMEMLKLRMSGQYEPEKEPEVLAVSTGIYAGPVEATTVFLTHRPTQQQDGWEDIEEFSLVLQPGQVLLGSAEVMPTIVHTLGEDDAGSYRVRVHANGRDRQYDLVVAEPVETYLIQFWPAAREQSTMVRNGSTRGKEMFQSRKNVEKRL